MSRTAIRVALAALLCLPLTAVALDPSAGDLAKESAAHVRVLSYNTQRDFVATPSTDAAYGRLIRAINPDIIAFQEINNTIAASDSAIAAAVKARLESYFPGQTWTVVIGSTDGFIRNALASRHPITLQRQDTVPASELRGVTMGLVNLPDANFGTTDFHVMAVHLKSGGTITDEERRQTAVDAIINWQRDLRSPGGVETLPTGTPMLVVGDYNVCFQDQGDQAPYRPSKTIIDGDIFNEATYGTDSKPDWDGTDATDAAPWDDVNADHHTQPASGPTSRLDRFTYTDSVIHVANRFVLNTGTMTSTALTAAALQSGDVTTASDHLPVVVDFALGPDPNPTGNLIINEFSFNDVGTDDRTFIEIRNTGGRPINLEAPVDYFLKVSNAGKPLTPPATENQNGNGFDLVGVVPPGGLFVLYNGTTDSSGIRTTIESALPDPKNRQNLSTFTLTNSDNVAIALTTVGFTDQTVTFEQSVDAYGYAVSPNTAPRYFRTLSGNNLLITLATTQMTTFGSGNVASDASISRLPSDTSPNSLGGWLVPATATPGTTNILPSAVEDWTAR